MDGWSVAMERLETAMRFGVARQGVLAANLAHADTPGYRARDLVFDAALARREAALVRTDARHLAAPEEAGAPGWRLLHAAGAPRADGNTVDADRELVELSRNASAFGRHAEATSRLLLLRQLAIGGR